MVRTKNSCVRLTVSALATLVQLAPSGVSGQQVDRLFPSRDFLVHVIAAPRAPVTGAKLVYNLDSPTEFGKTVDGEVAIGTSVPVYLIAGTSLEDGLVMGVEGAVFGRFALKTITRDMIATDWVFAIPFIWHQGNHWFRLRYRHFSSHLGDEYINRFDAEVENFSRDAADITAFYQTTPEFGLYGGGAWAFNIRPDESRRFLARFGAQIEAHGSEATFVPYGAMDVQWEQNNDWQPRLNVQIGVWLPKIEGRRTVRVAAEFLAGHSPLGQFHEEHVRHLTLGLYIEP